MRIATCGCGARWHDNHGAGHCAGCHRTFTSGAAFDAHRYDVGNGSRGCRDPETYCRKDGGLMFAARVDGVGVTVWEHRAEAAWGRAWFARRRVSAQGPI